LLLFIISAHKCN